MDESFEMWVVWTHQHGIESAMSDERNARAFVSELRGLDLVAYKGVQLNVSQVTITASLLEMNLLVP